MSNEYVIANKSDLTNIADAIREKNGGGSPLSLSEFVSAITGIETSGGADEILSLFGASKYVIVTSTIDITSTQYNICTIKEDNVNVADNVKLFVGVDNQYLAGVSTTVPSVTTGYGNVLAWVSFSINGLERTYITTDTNNLVLNEALHIYKKSYGSYMYYIDLNPIDNSGEYPVCIPNPMTTLILYSSPETT